METLEIIRIRASLKTHLSSREVGQDTILKVLEAARLAPSARNNQPWRFIVVRGKTAVDALVSAAFPEVNMVVKQAPVVILQLWSQAAELRATSHPGKTRTAGWHFRARARVLARSTPSLMRSFSIADRVA